MNATDLPEQNEQQFTQVSRIYYIQSHGPLVTLSHNYIQPFNVSYIHIRHHIEDATFDWLRFEHSSDCNVNRVCPQAITEIYTVGSRFPKPFSEMNHPELETSTHNCKEEMLFCQS